MSLEDRLLKLIKEIETERRLGDKRAEQFYDAIKSQMLESQPHIIDADGNLADITTKFNTLLDALEAVKILETS